MSKPTQQPPNNPLKELQSDHKDRPSEGRSKEGLTSYGVKVADMTLQQLGQAMARKQAETAPPSTPESRALYANFMRLPGRKG